VSAPRRDDTIADRPCDAHTDGPNLAPHGRRKSAHRAAPEAVALSCFRVIVRLDGRRLVQNHTQQGIMDFQIAVVVDESELPKFVHKDAHAWSRSADHLRQRRLADFRNHPFRLSFFAEIRH
jgi:hypothetical protein